MKTRVYCHNGKPENQKDYVEFNLITYQPTDIERVKEDHFSAIGENCYFKVEFIAENELDSRIINFFSFNDPKITKGYAKTWYTIQVKPALEHHTDVAYILPHISDTTFKTIDGYLKKDKEEYKKLRELLSKNV